MTELYNLTKNGKHYMQATRPQCLIKLERARSKAVINSHTCSYRGDNMGATLSISNGENWEIRLCSQ